MTVPDKYKLGNDAANRFYELMARAGYAPSAFGFRSYAVVVVSEPCCSKNCVNYHLSIYNKKGEFVTNIAA